MDQQPTPPKDKDPLKYKAADSTDWHTNVALFDLKSRSAPLPIQQIAQTYVSGVVRTGKLITSLSEFAYQSSKQTLFISNAVCEKLNTPSVTFEDLAKHTASLNIRERIAQQFNEDNNLGSEHLDEMLEIYGTSFVLGMSCRVKDVIQTLQAIYTSVIIESWLYFEVFAGDLWQAAMDHGSSIFSTRAIKKKDWGESEVNIKASKLHEMSLDPRRSLGTFFREGGIATFQKLRDIRNNYKVILGATSLLGGDIAILNAYRNALVHRAGKADAAFVNAVEDYPDFNHIKKGEQLPLDGEIVARLRKASIAAAHELLTKVLAVKDPAPTE